MESSSRLWSQETTCGEQFKENNPGGPGLRLGGLGTDAAYSFNTDAYFWLLVASEPCCLTILL